jgi:hypothetical protein
MAIERSENKVNNIKYLRRTRKRIEWKLVKQKDFIEEIREKLLYLFNYHIPNISSDSPFASQPIWPQFHIAELNFS